jgi:hypothetical protein
MRRPRALSKQAQGAISQWALPEIPEQKKSVIKANTCFVLSHSTWVTSLWTGSPALEWDTTLAQGPGSRHQTQSTPLPSSILEPKMGAKFGKQPNHCMPRVCSIATVEGMHQLRPCLKVTEAPTQRVIRALTAINSTSLDEAVTLHNFSLGLDKVTRQGHCGFHTLRSKIDKATQPTTAQETSDPFSFCAANDPLSPNPHPPTVIMLQCYSTKELSPCSLYPKWHQAMLITTLDNGTATS